jgi:hypothetical protein
VAGDLVIPLALAVARVKGCVRAHVGASNVADIGTAVSKFSYSNPRLTR